MDKDWNSIQMSDHIQEDEIPVPIVLGWSKYTLIASIEARLAFLIFSIENNSRVVDQKFLIKKINKKERKVELLTNSFYNNIRDLRELVDSKCSKSELDLFGTLTYLRHMRNELSHLYRYLGYGYFYGYFAKRNIQTKAIEFKRRPIDPDSDLKFRSNLSSLNIWLTYIDEENIVEQGKKFNHYSDSNYININSSEYKAIIVDVERACLTVDLILFPIIANHFDLMYYSYVWRNEINNKSLFSYTTIGELPYIYEDRRDQVEEKRNQLIC